MTGSRSTAGESLARNVLDSLLEGCQVIGTDHRYLYLNEAAVRHGRSTRGQLIGRTMMEVYPGIEDTAMFSVLRECMVHRKHLQLENEFTFPDGSKGWFELRFTPVPEGVSILSIDATDRKRAEARVQHLNAVLRGIRDVNQLITRERDPRALIGKACELLVESRGFETCAIVRLDGEQLLLSAVAGEESMLGNLRRALGCGDLPECIRGPLGKVVVRKNPATSCGGCPVNQHYSGDQDVMMARLESEGSVCGAILVSVPGGMITDEERGLLQEVAGDLGLSLRSIELRAERDAAIERLRVTGEELGAIIRSAPAAIFSFDSGDVVLSWNGAAERIFGWSAEEILGRPVPIVPEDKREEHERLRTRILRGEAFSELEVERTCKDGTRTWLSVSTAPLRDKEGVITGIMAVAVDISQRRQSETERQTVAAFLRLVNECDSTRELVERSVSFFRQRLDFDAVGIRLDEGDDFPYYEARGFPDEFVLLERSLCRRDANGHVVLDDDLNPVLDCMCGNVIRGRFDPTRPFFTPSGTFWTNSTTRLLASTTEEDRLARARNRCNGEGYESVALLPLRSGEQCMGLLQLNDRRPGRFTPENLAVHERLAAHLAVALAKSRADEALAESEKRFRSLLGAVSDVVWAATPDGQSYLYLSPSVAAVYGRSREEFQANPALWSEVVHPDDRVLASRQMSRFAAEGRADEVYRIVRPDGAVRWIHDRKTLVRDDAGIPVQIGGLATDITERREADDARWASEHRYRALFDNMCTGLAYCRMLYDGGRPVDFVYLEVNAAFEALTGLKNVAGRKVSDVIPGIRESDPRIFEIYGRIARTGIPERFEFYVEALREWFDVSAYCPQQAHFVAVFDVITKRKQTEEDLRCFSLRIEHLAAVVQDLSRVHSVDAIVDVVRQAARALAGSDGATFVLREGDSCHYVDEDATAPLWKGKRFPMTACISGWTMIHRQPAVVADIYSDDRIPHDAYRSTFVRSLVMVPIRSESPIGAIGAYWASPYRATTEDVHILQALADSTSVAMENARFVRELEEGKARTRAIYEHLPSPTFVWQRQGLEFVLADFNEAARVVTKGGVADFIGRSPRELCHGLPSLAEDLTRCFEQRTSFRREVDCGFPGMDERRRLVVTYGFVPSDMVILHAEDVTEQRRTEEQLKLSQRLEAVGRLAGGVAHDFNNLVGLIINYAGFAMDALRESDPVRADLVEVHNAGVRAAALTRQLLAFSRKQVLEPKVLSLNKAMAGVEGMLRRLLGEDIDIVVHLGDDLGSVKADPGQIEQVIMNLAINARDAMPQGGKLTIETHNVELDEEYAGCHVAVTPGRYVLLSVSDTGCGMDAVTREHIFEPFFTTKEKGKGTGLGLATVYGIVKQSGGSLWVYSELGHGTTFKAYFPRVDAPAVEVEPRRPSVMATGGETLLVVEDDDAVRRLVERILSTAGYRVLSVANGGEAMVVCERQRGGIALLLTDVVMPQMSGKRLAERLVEISPRLKVLYMSGYTDNAIVHHGVLDPGTRFVGKPFSSSDLLRKVREVLDEDRGGPPSLSSSRSSKG